MTTFLEGLLIGMGIGLIILPIGMGLFLMIRDTLERRKIKKMIKRGEFLITIDPKDYDVKAWEKEINVEEQKPFLENLNENIFNKKIK